MLTQIPNKAIRRDDYICTIDCTEPARLSPTTMISPTERDSIRLKTRLPHFDFRTANQKAGGSNPSGRAT